MHQTLICREVQRLGRWTCTLPSDTNKCRESPQTSPQCSHRAGALIGTAYGGELATPTTP